MMAETSTMAKVNIHHIHIREERICNLKSCKRADLMIATKHYIELTLHIIVGKSFDKRNTTGTLKCQWFYFETLV